MGKRDRENVNRALVNERNTTNSQFNAFTNTLNAERPAALARANDQADSITSGYQNIVNRGGLDPTVVANLRALSNRNNSTGSSDSSGSSDSVGGVSSGTPSDRFGSSRAVFNDLAATGGVDMAAMTEALPGYRDIASTGGYTPEDATAIRAAASRSGDIGTTGGFDPGTLAAIRGDIAGLRSIGQTGGLTEADINRARGLGVFDEFARTGGYSPEDIQNIRARATSTIPAQYSNDLRNIEQSNRLLGRAAPNYGATIARLGRNRGMALADAARNAEVDIQGAIRENRLAGAREASSSELTLQELLTGNRLRGLEGAATGETTLADTIARNQIAGNTAQSNILNTLNNNIAGNRLGALGGITNTQQGAADISQRGRIAGGQGLFGIESSEASLAAQQAALDAAASADASANDRWWAQFGAGNEQFIGQMGLEGELGALGGLNNQYGTTPGALNMYGNQLLNSMGGRNQGAMNTLQLQQQNIGPSVMDRIMQGVGAAGGVLGGLSGLGVGRSVGNAGQIRLPSNYPGF